MRNQMTSYETCSCWNREKTVLLTMTPKLTLPNESDPLKLYGSDSNIKLKLMEYGKGPDGKKKMSTCLEHRINISYLEILDSALDAASSGITMFQNIVLPSSKKSYIVNNEKVGSILSVGKGIADSHGGYSWIINIREGTVTSDSNGLADWSTFHLTAQKQYGFAPDELKELVYRTKRAVELILTREKDKVIRANADFLNYKHK